ncbi:MAG: hypothetical protein KAH04_07620 [Psychrilyobacter sp.]|nr:hypothetical protein [Psychrilyobacter sp.]
MKRIAYLAIYLIMVTVALGAPSIYPSIVKMDLKKGHAFSTVTVFNTGDKSMKYKLAINDMDNLGIESKLAPYLTLFPKFMEIAPGESQVVRIIAKGIPIDEFKDGEYRGAIAIEELDSSIHKEYKSKEAVEGVTTTINFKYIVNMAVYGYIGELKPKVKVTNLKINKENITGSIENIGNYSYPINYEILNKSGKVVNEGVLFKILYGQKETFKIENTSKGVKIRLLEKEKDELLYK